MIRQFVLLGMFCTTTAWAAADPPFAPNADAPDYVVTMIERPAVGTMQRSRSVVHHGDWTRVDTIDGDGKTTDYFARNNALQISGTGRTYIEVKLRPVAIGWDTESRSTGEREAFLGESCTVWNVQRVKPSYSPSKLEELSCITDDGIELWHCFVGSHGVMSSSEATAIERHPIAMDEVQPPQNLLALDWWNNDEQKASLFRPDFEVVFQVGDGMRPAGPNDGKQTIQIIRRHYPWTYDEVKEGGALSRLTISHAGRMQLSFVSGGADAEKSLSIWRRPSAEQPASGIKGENMNRSETILGEQCRWFDLMPGAADAGSAECRTDDGIPLKFESERRGMSTGMSTAVRFARRPLTLDDVKPPDEMLSLDWWMREGHSRER